MQLEAHGVAVDHEKLAGHSGACAMKKNSIDGAGGCED
jgi:hypothetical protein